MRQPERDRRNVGDEHRDDEHDSVERPDAACKRFAAYAGEDNVKKFRDMVDQARKV
jgi:hypothetical protein